MRLNLGISFIALFFAVSVKAESCLPVQGLQFEKIGSFELLIIRDGKNWGIMTLLGIPADGKMEFRFFTPTICDGSQNREIQINGKLTSISNIKPFK